MTDPEQPGELKLGITRQKGNIWNTTILPAIVPILTMDERAQQSSPGSGKNV